MALSFTIGGVSFAALGTTAGRKAMAFLPGNPSYDISRFHVKGSNGNFIIRGGKDGGRIYCRGRYIGLLDTAMGLYFSDVEAWANAAISVVGHGKTYASCNLDKDGAKISKEPVAMGRGTVGQVYFDADFTFTHDGA